MAASLRGVAKSVKLLVHTARVEVLSLCLGNDSGSRQARVEITGEDKTIQVTIDGKEVVPLDVKLSWGYGSVDDPDGIVRNSETLSQILGCVLDYNRNRVGSYICMTALIIRVQCVFFLRFHIMKNDANDPGSLELLEYVPGFTRGRTAEASLWEVHLVNMAERINGKFGLNRKWSEHVLQDMNMPEALAALLKTTSFQELLPASPPEGFHSLVKYFRTVASHCYIEVQFLYESQEGSIEVSRVLASGTNSCVFATAGMSSVIKVSSEESLELEMHSHSQGDTAGCCYLRRMIGHGRIVGAGPGLRFVELEGVGVPWAKKHVSSEEQIAKCWNEASLAVKALHGKKVFHRDIKPSNFIIMEHGTERQRLVLYDLNCAALWDDAWSMNDVVGTPMFRSPLLDEEGDYDYCCRDDWLSLGLSFAYLLGIFPEHLERNNNGKVEVLKELLNRAGLPEDMKKTINEALSSEHVCCYRAVSYVYL